MCRAPPGSLDNQGHGTHAAGNGRGRSRDAAGARLRGRDRARREAHRPGRRLHRRRSLHAVSRRRLPGEADADPRAGVPAGRAHSLELVGRPARAAARSCRAANYPQSAYDIDAFVWSHPDLLVVFNTGNLGQVGRRRSARSRRPAARRTRCRSAARARRATTTTRSRTSRSSVRRATAASSPISWRPRACWPATCDFDDNPATCDDSTPAGDVVGVANGGRRGRARAAVLHRRLLSERRSGGVERASLRARRC